MEQAAIDRIVARVVALIQARMVAAAPPQRVLMLFSGASTGYVVGMDAIRMLSQGNHDLTVFLTPSAKHVIGMDNVRAAGAQEIIGPEQWVDTPSLVRTADLVLVPTLSMNTAARLALGLMDSLFSTLVLGSLLAGKPVIAIADGADPYGNGGRIFSESSAGAPALRAVMAANLNTLVDYGVNLVAEELFTRAVIRELLGEAPRREVAVEPELPALLSDGRATILTAGDLSAYQQGATVRLPANARLTPLAQESAARRNLNLIVA